MEELIQGPICPNCSNNVVDGLRFCSKCGNKLPVEISKEKAEKIVSPKNLWISIFLFFILIFIGLYVRYFHKYGSAFFTLKIDIFFSSCILIGTFLTWSDAKEALRFRKINWKLFLGVLIVPFILGFCFHYLVKFINVGLYHSDFDIYMFDETNNVILFSFLGICLQPGLFEELAYRGIIFGSLQKYMNDGSVIFVSALLFAISHLTLIGLIWLLPVGLILGWLRMKTKCIYYGIIFHTLYNFSAILLTAHERGVLHL